MSLGLNGKRRTWRSMKKKKKHDGKEEDGKP